MSFARSQDNGDGFAFSGRHAFAGRHAADGPSIDPYGFSGESGNEMLAAGLLESRAFALRTPDVLELPTASAQDSNPGVPRLPEIGRPEAVNRWGTEPRAAIAMGELMSRMSFEVDGECMTLAMRNAAGTARPLARLQRPTRDEFVTQLDLVRAKAAQRDVRMNEILTQVLPPTAYFASVVDLQADRNPRTMALLGIALQWAYAVGMRFKHTLNCPRPSEYSAFVQPMIEVPLHASFPAGHATEGHVAAAVLQALSGEQAGSLRARALRRVAWRIADNRVVAGLHFPADLAAGTVLGDALAGYFIAACSANPLAWCEGRYALADVRAEPDADAAAFADAPAGIGAGDRVEEAGTGIEVLQVLWTGARAEWQRH